MSQHSPVRVICFGDSLTAGFQSPTRENPQGQSTPYGDWVQERLGDAGEVRVSGICGELTAEMLTRFRRDVLVHEPHYVVILGEIKTVNCPPNPDENSLMRLLYGDTDVFFITYTNKVRELPKEKRDVWFKVLSGARIEKRN